MGEAKIRELRAVEGRAAMAEAQRRRSRIRDRFGRGLEVNDGVLLGQVSAYEVVWRIAQLTPAVGLPNVPAGAMFADVVAQSRVLFMPGVPSDNVTLVMPANEVGDNARDTADESGGAREENPPPGSAVSPSGLIIPPDDGHQNGRGR